MRTFLRQLGYDARPAVIGEINKETQYVLNQAGLEAPELLTDAIGLNMILVDQQAYEDLKEIIRYQPTPYLRTR